MTDWDEKLNISTESVDYSVEDAQNYGYDPTPYVVLEKLLCLDMLKKDDIVIDYGCGKGRVSIFLNHQVGCRTIGVDHSQKLLKKASENLKSHGGSEGVSFVHSKAEDFSIGDATCLYFFNPFSTKIFRKVLKRVEESYKTNPRDIIIFFYYSTIEYKLYLPTEKRLDLIESLEFDAEMIDSPVPARLSVFRFQPLKSN